MTGKSRADLHALQAGEIAAALGGLQPESRHAAVLCVDGVRALVKQSGGLVKQSGV